MNKKSIWIGVIVIVVIIILVSVSGKKSAAPATVKLGLISPLTGLVEGGDNLGQSFANGVILAKEEYEKNNSTPKVTIITEDDGYDSKKGLSAYKKETSIDGIRALINLSSPTIDVIKSDVQAKGFPVIQLGAESQVTKDNIFQIYPDQTAVSMLGDTANNESMKTVTVVMEQLQAYEKFISDFQAAFTGSTTIIRVPTTETDYKPTALKIKQARSQGLVMFTGSKAGAQILSRMNEIGYRPTRIYFDLTLQLGLSDYKTVLGKSSDRVLDGAEALYSVAKVDPTFTAKYKARFGAEPGELSGHGYDAFNVMMSAYDAKNLIWLANIQKYSAEGVTGKISFDSQGLRPPEFTIATFKNGVLVTK